MVHASHVTRTRHMHQVTAATLHCLLREAYVNSSSVISFNEWCAQRAGETVHFAFWYKTLELEMLLFLFVRSLREGSFDLYVQTIIKLMPWMFALDRTNYSRWLSVHIQDMLMLQDKHPTVYSAFLDGQFVVHKTQKKFSAIPIDQAHEQLNATIKGTGGAVGLTSNPSALRGWMIAGSEVPREPL